MLDLRRKADKILSCQYGQNYSLVDTIEFMKVLRDFNKKAESNYSALQKPSEKTEDEKQQDFLEYLTLEYNQILTSWLPDEKFMQFHPIEPLIPLQKLKTFKGINTVKIKQLQAISELLSLGWEYVGHQPIQAFLPNAKEIAVALDNYYLNQRGLNTLVAKIVTDFQIITIPQLINIIEKVELKLLLLLDDLPKEAETIICRKNARNYVQKYLSESKATCLAEQWEELALPTLPEDIFFGNDDSDSSFMTEGLSNISSWGAKLIAKTGGKVGSYVFVKFYLIPKIMDALKTKGEELSDDDTIKLSLKKILQELEAPLLDFLTAIPFNLFSEEGIWFLLLDKLLPIFEHPSTIEATRILSKESTVLLKSLVTFIKTLQPYRTQPLKELLNLKTLFSLLHRASQLDLIQQLLNNPIFKEILNRFSILDEKFFSSFYHFNFKSLLSLFYLLGHPVFYNFLKVLPPEASFAHLKAWLNPETKKIPGMISQAREAVFDYQNNRERLEENNCSKIQGLKKRYTLSKEIVRQDLKALEPVFPEEPVSLEPEPFLSRLLAWAFEHWLKSLILAAVIILFSWIILPVALVGSIIYAGIILYEKCRVYIKGNYLPEEVYIEPVIKHLSSVEQSTTLLEEVDLEEEMSFIEEEASDGDVVLEIFPQNGNKVMNHCYPANSNFSLGLFVNSNSQETLLQQGLERVFEVTRVEI